MYRARLAPFTLAAGLLALTGCNSCGPGLNLFHRQHPTTDCTCSHGAVAGAVSGFEGPALVPGETVMPSPSTSPPPRIVPQANPVPYAPAQATGLRKLFDRQP
jgi:hypothetical protein